MNILKKYPFWFGAVCGIPLGLFASSVNPWYVGLTICLLVPIIFGLCAFAVSMIKK